MSEEFTLVNIIAHGLKCRDRYGFLSKKPWLIKSLDVREAMHDAGAVEVRVGGGDALDAGTDETGEGDTA